MNKQLLKTALMFDDGKKKWSWFDKKILQIIFIIGAIPDLTPEQIVVKLKKDIDRIERGIMQTPSEKNIDVMANALMNYKSELDKFIAL